MALQETPIPTTRPAAGRLSTCTALQRLGRTRDPAAWRAILETHGLAILNLARRITGDVALAEDVCQETLLQIRAYADRFRPVGDSEQAEAGARGWIMRIACHTASRMLRQRTAARRREECARPQAGATAPSAGELALSREEAVLVRQELAALDEPLREAVCLHFYAGQPYAELAGSLACSMEAAKKRVQRGLVQLRSRLVKRGVTIGLIALTTLLAGGAANAAEGLAAGAVALDAQRQVLWQALLNSSQQPAFSCAAHMGGALIVTKTSLLAASVVVFCLASVSAYYLGELRHEKARSQTAAMEENVRQLQQQLTTARQELDTLRTDLADRQDEHRTVTRQVDELQQQLTDLKAKQNDPATIAFAPGMITKDLPPEAQGIVKELIAGAPFDVQEEQLDVQAQADANGATGNPTDQPKGVQVKRFKLPGGGEGQIMTMQRMIVKDGDVKTEQTPDGNVIHRFNIGADQGQIVIQMNGQDEPKPQSPPKVREEF